MSGRPPRVLAEAGYVSEHTLPRGPNGRALCRRCNEEVRRPRMTFCGPACVHEWKIRSQPGYARKRVWERDLGKCALCATVCTRANVGRHAVPWEMDHALPVVEGGGSCGLDNLRTLCRPCHRRVTAQLAGRRAEERRAQRRLFGGGS